MAQSRKTGMRYEIQLDCKDENSRVEIIDADGDQEAHNKAKAWARSLEIPLDKCWLIVKNANGRFKTFKPDEL
jgi:hypothetical protein